MSSNPALDLIQTELERLLQAKENAVANQDFELAVAIREKYQQLKSARNELMGVGENHPPPLTQEQVDKALKMEPGFISQVNHYCGYIADWATRKKFRVDGVFRNFAEQLMLVVTEVAELCEANRARKGENSLPKPDRDCPMFSKEEIEAADAVIRVFDMGGAYRWRLGEAIVAKMTFNELRPEKHGKAY
jgi:hypothetical protein